MLLEPDSRFFKIYDVTVTSQIRTSTPLKIVSDDSSETTIETLLQSRKAKGKIELSTDDTLVELVDVRRTTAGNLVLFFHREARKASDPVWRSSRPDGSVATSKYKKKSGEQQAVSGHLVISKVLTGGGYRCALEEVPGLGIPIIRTLLGQHVFAHMKYSIHHPKTKKPMENTAILKFLGMASENLKDTLSSSTWRTVTLIKPADRKVVDGIPWMNPRPQRMKIKVSPELKPADYLDSLKKLLTNAEGQGWDNLRIEMDFPDERSKQVSVQRDRDAEEIIFVRSKKLKINANLENCAEDIVIETVAAAETLL